jgi:hypothetical protein
VDLHLYLRVLWRFRVLVLFGLLAAVALSFLSYVRVTPDGFEYRADEEWASYATLLVTGPELSLSSSVEPGDDPSVQAERLTAQQAAIQQYTTLAIVYARLADSDAVLRYIRRSGALGGRVEAAPISATDDNTGETLPLISVAAVSTSPEQAHWLGEREVAALQGYLAERQRAENVSFDQRVVFEVVKKPTKAILLTGRSKTLPIVVFLTLMIAVVGLAFVLENLRPRVRSVSSEPSVETEYDRGRRTA